ncbi:hypothetical protein [Streptomyces lasiicapitis]|uniref:hypothetical protein n=1 Tax=Streptomyces lasiicapitis TaxID=1923961 RepID=UPI003659E73C
MNVAVHRRAQISSANHKRSPTRVRRVERIRRSLLRNSDQLFALTVMGLLSYCVVVLAVKGQA